MAQGLIVGYLEKSDLTLYLASQSFKISLSEEDLKIKLADLIESNKLGPQKVVLVLSSQLFYQQDLSLDDPLKTEEDYHKFLEGIKENSEQLTKLKVYEGNLLRVFVVNYQVYKELSQTLESVGWKIEAVVPDLKLEDEFNSATYTHLHTFSKYNFLKTKEINILPSIKKTIKVNKKNKILSQTSIIGAVLAILVVLTISGLILLRSQFSSDQPKTVTSTVLPTLIPTINPVPTSVAKEDLKIRILNGSGISGQAGKLQTSLEKLGFKNIETGNTGKKESGSSLIYFSPKIEAEVAGEIKKALEKTLGKMVEDASSSGEVDVLVITKR